MGSRRRPRQRRTWPQRLGLLTGVLVAAASVVAIVGLNYANSKADQLNRVALGPVLGEEVESGEPLNFLLIGVDSAAGLDPDDPIAIDRTDTQLTDTLMLLRVDPGSNQAHLMSLPRDLVLELPDAGYEERINAALAIGGPELLVRAIEENFDLPLNHYLQVDFEGFLGLVDAVDGVPLWLEYPVRDVRTGLVVRSAGCHTFTPDEALAFVRSRALEQRVDGEWKNLDLTPDLARIDRQQEFVVAALKRALSKGARNLRVLNDLVNVGIGNLVVDERLTPNDILDLGERFRAFQADTLVTMVPPVVDAELRGAQVLRLSDGPEAQAMFDVFRGVTGRRAGPESVRVLVSNGAGTAGLGSMVAADLARVGFDVVGFGDAPDFDVVETVVRTTTDGRAAARLLARWLAVEVPIEIVEATSQGEVELVLGLDWAGVLESARPAPEPSRPTPGAAPEVDQATADEADPVPTAVATPVVPSCT